jgi:two-component system, chemotaxis family, response regulator Rcp1
MSPPHILLVEDNPHDALLTIKALTNQSTYTLSAVEDGVQALEYLRGQQPYSSAQLPQLILLDLKLPRKSGFELLAEIKADPQLKDVPVIVLTNSSPEDDILRRCAGYATGYLEKPNDPAKFIAAVRAIVQSWLDNAVLLA